MSHLADFLRFKRNNTIKKVNLLEDSLVAFADITGVPVSFYSTSGTCMWTCNGDMKICSANDSYGKEDTNCTRSLSSAMNISLNLGEVYVFTCHSGLINLCYALIIEEKLCGFLIAGPMTMGTNRDKTISVFSQKITGEKIDYTKLIPVMANIPLFTPKNINSISVMFTDAIIAPLEINRSSNNIYQRNQEQILISKRLLQMKKNHLDVEYPYVSETKLTDTIKTGNEKDLQKVFYKYMEDIMVFEGGNLSLIKIRIIALISQLLRTNDEWKNSYEHLFWLDEINKAATVSDVIHSGLELVSALTVSISAGRYSGSSEIVKKAVAYINANYKQNINLTTISENIHVNSAYLSVLFKKEFGMSAVSYIQSLRLSHAEEMLAGTDMPISQVGLECGFSSQSYFTKLFREKHGLTPKEFRAKSS